VTRVPPRIVRRLVLTPLVVAVEAVVLVLSPLWLLVAALLSPLFGGRRPVRVVTLVIAFTARHLEALERLLALWLRRDVSHEAHLDVMRTFVLALYRVIVRVARVQVVTEESPEASAALESDRPIVLLSRHAGEGDTLLVLHELLARHRRMPRIVMHQALRLDPLVDVLGARLPNRFVDPRGGDTEKDIAALAGDLDGRSALVIFPEGANFSEERRRRGIERLERGGHDAQAQMAREMRHVSAPRPGGALAAIDAAPGADVVIMGHRGFPAGVREVWDLLPERQTVEVKLWHAPAASIPDDHDARIAWLFDRWRELDAWVEAGTAASG
jgi:1-acyl-sn-glycerol-3-phosphate acyltransferase